MMSVGMNLGREEKHRLCDAFAQNLPYPSCYHGGELLWRDASKKPNVMQPELYQHPHRRTKRWCPRFIRFAVNFSVPWTYRRNFWEKHEILDTSGVNYKIEITVLPDEARPLAEWLPGWLTHREGVNTDLPDPPRGMDRLLLWAPRHGHVYFWSEAADESYEAWMAEQKEFAECR
jgi:hypothetical protein